MAAVIQSIFPRLFYFQLFSVIMILAPGVNALIGRLGCPRGNHSAQIGCPVDDFGCPEQPDNG